MSFFCFFAVLVVSTSTDVITMVLMEMRCSFLYFPILLPHLVCAPLLILRVWALSMHVFEVGPLIFEWVIGLPYQFPNHSTSIKGIRNVDPSFGSGGSPSVISL